MICLGYVWVWTAVCADHSTYINTISLLSHLKQTNSVSYSKYQYVLSVGDLNGNIILQPLGIWLAAGLELELSILKLFLINSTIPIFFQFFSCFELLFLINGAFLLSFSLFFFCFELLKLFLIDETIPLHFSLFWTIWKRLQKGRPAIFVIVQSKAVARATKRRIRAIWATWGVSRSDVHGA